MEQVVDQQPPVLLACTAPWRARQRQHRSYSTATPGCALGRMTSAGLSYDFWSAYEVEWNCFGQGSDRLTD